MHLRVEVHHNLKNSDFISGSQLEAEDQASFDDGLHFVAVALDLHGIAVAEEEGCVDIKAQHLVELDAETQVRVEEQVAGVAVAFAISVKGELAEEHVQVDSNIRSEHLADGEVAFCTEIECPRRSGLVVASGFNLETEFRTEVDDTHLLRILHTEMERNFAVIANDIFVTDGERNVQEGVHGRHKLVADHDWQIGEAVDFQIIAIPVAKEMIAQNEAQFQVRNNGEAGADGHFVPRGLVLHAVVFGDLGLALVVFENRELVPGCEGSSCYESGCKSYFFKHFLSPWYMFIRRM